MQKTQYPNSLRALIKQAGLTIREVHEETAIPESTLRWWASGNGVIPRKDRDTLARLIGCSAAELAPSPEHLESDNRMNDRQSFRKSGPLTHYTDEEWDGCFSFGRLKTVSMVLDGDGAEVYLPSNIHTHYDPQPATFYDEVMAAKRQIQWEQEEKQRKGEPYQWNGSKYHLSRISVSREAVHENMTLGLWFKPRDHYTGLATRRCLDDPTFREKYLTGDWYTPIVGMSMSMGVDLMVISSDGFVFLTQRGLHQSVHQGTYHISISEAVSPSFDRGITNQAPDLYRCACRGLAEELGLEESADFSLSDILFLSFSVDTRHALYGLRGMVKVRKSAEEILSYWRAGVKDKLENQKLIAIPFTPEEVCEFVFSHSPWANGLVCLYHTLVHEFGRQKVNTVLSSY